LSLLDDGAGRGELGGAADRDRELGARSAATVSAVSSNGPVRL
jgi:hypothetical protein